MILDIADAVRTQPNNPELLTAWNMCDWSTTITTNRLETAERHLWSSLHQRQHASAARLVVRPSCFQSVHELPRLRHYLK